jgi:hypothetical protein
VLIGLDDTEFCGKLGERSNPKQKLSYRNPTMNGIQKKRENMNPEEYTNIGWYYCGDSKNQIEHIIDMGANIQKGWQWLEEHNFPTDTHIPCSHCGTRHAWGVIYKDENDNEFNVGCQCAVEFFEYDDKYAYEMKETKRKIQLEKEKREHLLALEQFKNNNPEIWDMLQTDRPFIKSVKYTVEKLGRISDRQIEAVKNVINSEKRKEERKKNVDNLKSGRYELTGKVISTKYQYTRYGDTPKMLLELNSGQRVFGAIPTAICQLPKAKANGLVSTLPTIGVLTNACPSSKFPCKMGSFESLAMFIAALISAS